MKIKIDFVTNSSSSSYIIAIKYEKLKNIEDILDNLLDENPHTNEGCSVREVFQNVKELAFYVNGECEVDWVQECTGPKYEYMSKENYDKCVEEINKGCIIAYLSVDYDLTDEFTHRSKGIIEKYIQID